MTDPSDIKQLISPELVIVARRLLYGLALIFFIITNWGNTFFAGSMLLEYGFAILGGHQDPGQVLGDAVHARLLAETSIRFILFFFLAFVIDQMLKSLSFRLCDTAYFTQKFEALAQERLKILQAKTNLMEYERQLCEYSDGLAQQFNDLETRLQNLIRLSVTDAERKAASTKPKRQPPQTGDIFDFKPKPPVPKPKTNKLVAWRKPTSSNLPKL